MSVYDVLAALRIELAQLQPPVAAFQPFVRAGGLLFLSGHIARRDGKPWVGVLGRTMETGEGRAAARAVAVDLMGTLHAAGEKANA